MGSEFWSLLPGIYGNLATKPKRTVRFGILRVLYFLFPTRNMYYCQIIRKGKMNDVFRKTYEVWLKCMGQKATQRIQHGASWNHSRIWVYVKEQKSPTKARILHSNSYGESEQAMGWSQEGLGDTGAKWRQTQRTFVIRELGSNMFWSSNILDKLQISNCVWSLQILKCCSMCFVFWLWRQRTLSMRLDQAQVSPVWGPYSKASWTSLFMFLIHLKLNVSQTELIV